MPPSSGRQKRVLYFPLDIDPPLEKCRQETPHCTIVLLTGSDAAAAATAAAWGVRGKGEAGREGAEGNWKHSPVPDEWLSVERDT